MKQILLTTAAASLLLVGCFPAKIVTVSTYDSSVAATPVYTQTYAAPYTTVVTSPRHKTVTSTTYSVSAVNDLSLYLDLQAVGAAFAQSSSIQEFESLLNNYSYIISNLDLNADGYVDYLRVVETVEGYNHLFVIQAVLGLNIYQDVATLVVEAPSLSSYYVQIVGDPYLYGPGYYIRPIYVNRPIMIQHFCRPGYRPWMSPWYWDHYPSHYRYPHPLQLGHYQSYVHTYMRDHRYCNSFEYNDRCHYQNYDRVVSGVHRNDYGQQYPERSFSVRTANIPASNGARATNARGISEAQRASTTTTTSGTSRASRTTPSATTSSASSAKTSTASRSTTSSVSGAPAKTTPAASSRSTSTQSTSSTVRSSGSSSTSIRTTSPSGSTSTVSRSTSARSSSASSSSANRSSSASSSSTSRSSSASSSSTSRSSSASSSSASRSSSGTSRSNSTTRSSR